MVPPSIFILLSALSAFQLSLSESLDSGGIVQDVPNEMETHELLLQTHELQELADRLALDYLYGGDIENLSNLAKRVPGSSSDSVDKKDTISSMHRVFAREGVPPSIIKLSFGKRGGDDKRYSSPYYFGKREDDDKNDLNKRAYSHFVFGKRDADTPLSADKRGGSFSPFLYGKRADLQEDKRSGYSALYFGKRVPEMAKKAYSGFYFGKRGTGKFNKFMFGKRERDELAEE